MKELNQPAKWIETFIQPISAPTMNSIVTLSLYTELQDLLKDK